MAVRDYTNIDSYYGDENQWGQHQYVTLKDVVNNFMSEIKDHDYLSNVDRQRVITHAKKGIQQLYYDVLNEVVSIEFDLNPALIIPLPHDYVSYVRISWVDAQGRLHPLAVDNTKNLAKSFLQDHDYNYLYDNEGGILEGSHIQDTSSSSTTTNHPYDNNCTPNFNLNRSKIFKNGSYRIDKDRGIIQFSSKVQSKTIALDYISDGLFQREDSEIRIHKFAEEALDSFIYYKLIRRTREAEREKMRAEKTWYNDRRLAKRRIKPIRLEEIRQVLKGSSKWIKD